MTSIKRESLRELEGQIVYFQGFLDTWRRGDGVIDTCLSTVDVSQWDGQSPIGQCRRSTRLDHVWLRITEPDHAWCPKRLEVYESVGRVGWYRRRDGSVDLGIDWIPGICLERCLERFGENFRNRATWGERLDWLNQLLEVADAYKSCGRGVVYSYVKTVEEGLTELRRFRDRLSRDQAKNMAALTTAMGRGPCTGLDAGLGIKPQTTRAATGFA